MNADKSVGINFCDFLLESSSMTIKRLIEVFGKYTVYLKSLTYQLNDEDLLNIRDIFNETLFESSLDDIPLRHDNFKGVNSKYAIVTL